MGMLGTMTIREVQPAFYVHFEFIRLYYILQIFKYYIAFDACIMIFNALTLRHNTTFPIKYKF